MLYIIAWGAFVAALGITAWIFMRSRVDEDEDAGLLADLNHKIAVDRLRASANRRRT